MSNDIATTKDQELIFAPENITKDTIKKYLCKLANDQELMMGLQICKEFKLNPLKREVYFIKYGDEPMAVVLGYEVYLKRADRTGKYAGLKTWTEGTVKDSTLKGCVEVTVKGWEKPLYHEVDYSEYVGKKKDGNITRFWSKMPKTMIKKVAVAQAFKLAFPDEFAGLPQIAEEMNEDNIVDVQIDPTKSRVEQLVEQQFVTEKDLSPEVKEDAPKELSPDIKKDSKIKKDKDRHEPVKNDTPVLPEGHKTAQGIITDPPTYAEIGAEKKPKWVFKMGELKLGTFEKSVFEGICAIMDLQQGIPILLNIEYKERQSGEKTLRDIVNFKQAITKTGKDVPI